MKRPLVLLLLAAACARGPVAAPPAPAEPAALEPGRVTPEDSARANALYSEARARFDARDYAAADSLASLVVEAYASAPSAPEALWLSARSAVQLGARTRAKEAIGRYAALFPEGHPQRLSARILLADLLVEELDAWAAAETLLAAEPRLTGAQRDSAARVLRQAVALLSLRDVQDLIARHPARSPFSALLYTERALHLAADARVAEARSAAERALDQGALPEDAARAREILRAREAARRGPPTLAAVLPLSGHLAPFGRSLREGIELAFEEHRRLTGDSIGLVIADDSSSAQLSAQRLAELEARGVLAVVGPVAEEGLRAAALRRTEPDLVLLSPLAREARELGSNVYSLWMSLEDLERLARTLAQWGVRQMGARRIGVVFPADPTGYRQYDAFAQEARLQGAEILAAEPYPPDVTTFEAPLSRLDSVKPEAVYAVATTPRAVVQLAPQLSYYGLRGIQILGDPNWADPEALRLLDPRFINGTVAATYFDRWSPESGWPRFVDMYEARYRKGLGNNVIPALGYDAASLLLRAVPSEVRGPSVLARRLRQAIPYRGATGLLRVEGDRIVREPVVVEIRDRQVFRAYPRPIQRPPAPADTLSLPPGRRR